jgi:hypothetical protein
LIKSSLFAEVVGGAALLPLVRPTGFQVNIWVIAAVVTAVVADSGGALAQR